LYIRGLTSRRLNHAFLGLRVIKDKPLESKGTFPYWTDEMDVLSGEP